MLYLALEDNERRLASRMRTILNGRSTDGLHRLDTRIRGEWKALSEGGADALEAYIKENDTRLAIIDTVARISMMHDGKSDKYQFDTAHFSRLHKVALETGCCILGVLHMRKSKSDSGDWLDEIMGSQGVTGVADTLIGLYTKRGSPYGEINVTGRDVDDLLFWCKRGNHAWEITDDPIEALGPRERQIALAVKGCSNGITWAALAGASNHDLSKEKGNYNNRLNKLTDQGVIAKDEEGHYVPGEKLVNRDGFS